MRSFTYSVLCMQDSTSHHHHESRRTSVLAASGHIIRSYMYGLHVTMALCGQCESVCHAQLKITTSSAGLFLSDSRSRGRHVALLRGTRGPWSLAWEPTTGYGLRLPHAGSRIDAERCELILVVRGGSGDDLRLLRISTVWSGAEWDCRRQGGNELRDPVYWPLRCDRLRNDQVSFETT
jgi:hypothetical protein